MNLLFAALLGAVALYCCCRTFIPAWRDEGHAIEMDLTHVLMGAAMVAMFVSVIPTWANGPAMGLFAGATVWFLAKGLRDLPRAAVLRLSVMCLAMTYMLVPTAASAESSHHAGNGHVSSGADGGMLGWAMIAIMVAVAVAAAVILFRPHRTGPNRLSSACEVAMAVAMGYMLAV